MRPWGYAICIGVAVGLIAPASALAARSATTRERHAITHAAAIADSSPTQSVRVTNINVSTAGPWATATVSLYLKHDKKPEMVSEETFFQLHGQWWDTTNGNAPHRTPPPAVVSDLGLPGSGGTSSNVAHIIAYVFIGLLVLGLLALIGKISPRTGTRSAGPPSQTGGGVPAGTLSSWGPKGRRTCPSCGGSRPACYVCQGRGTVPNPNFPQWGSQFMNCTLCHGAGKTPPPCPRCGDRGWVEN